MSKTTLHARHETQRLGKSDWTDAAISTLLYEGIDAVQITRLAKTLGVSRGSFYWHFDDRQALLNAMVCVWQDRNSNSVMQAVSEASSLSEGVLGFFSLWVDGKRFSPNLEQSVRDWARLDDTIMSAVHEEDAARISHLARLFEQFNYTSDEASVRARVLYFAQIGYYAMHLQENMADRLALLPLYYTTFTGQKIEKKALQKFTENYGEYR